MSATGFVRALNTGVVYVVATVGTVSDRAELTVVPAVAPVASVFMAPGSANVVVGQTVTLAATPRDASGAALTGRSIVWSSNENVIATVSPSGLVSGQSPGTAIITAESEGQRGTATVSVGPAPVAGVTLSSGNLTVNHGEVRTISATARDASGTVLTGRSASWSSSSPGVATVTSTGPATASISAVGAGTTTITATIEGQAASINFSVGASAPVAVASVTVSPTTATVAIGATQALSAVTRDANGNILSGRAITWSSSATTVATVSSTGVVTGNGQGTATVTATSEGRTGTSTVTVPAPPAPAPVATVTLSPTSASLTAGATQQLSATLRDANGNVLTGRSISWSSSASAVATVSSSGLVTAVAQGSATITATSEERSGTAAIAVTQSTGGGTGTVYFANEPAGMTRIADWTFPTLSGSGWSYQQQDAFARVVQDATAPTDASVVEFVFPLGYTGGGAPARVAAPNLGSGRTELYWAFTWKANDGWQNHSSWINKLGYGWQNGRSTFGLTWHWYGGNNPPSISLFDAGITYFHSNTAQAAPIRAGVWYEVEVHYRPSSATGRADGIVRIWIDGVLVANHVNVVTTAGTINDVYFEPTWGGIGDTKRQADNMRFGQARISVR